MLFVTGCSSGGGGNPGAAGSGGTSGAGGDAGSAGTAGDAGVSGTAGDGGATGTAGSGGGGGGVSGTTGSGGATAGTGGSGTAGRGGSGGTTGTAGRGGGGGATGTAGPRRRRWDDWSGGARRQQRNDRQRRQRHLHRDVIQGDADRDLRIDHAGCSHPTAGRDRAVRRGADRANPHHPQRRAAGDAVPRRERQLARRSPGDRQRGRSAGPRVHPQYASNGRFFVFYNRRATDPFTTGNAYDIVVAEGARGASADVASPTLKPLFVLAKKNTGHTGGTLAFGPDGNLYISNGDDADGTHSPDPASKFGKILRVNVGSAAPTTPNLVPDVFQLGLRNPWRFSFDRANGDMWIADVGERIREEIDYVPAGSPVLNFGWPTMEGSMCYSAGCSMTGLTLPVYDYGRDQGQTVVGGFVYRGSNIPCLRGRYIFADWNQPGLWTFVLANGQVTGMLDHTAVLNNQRTLSSFGEDLAGELYSRCSNPAGCTGSIRASRSARRRGLRLLSFR